MAARCRSSSSRRRTSRGRTLGGDATVACGRCLRNPSLSRLILADSRNSGGAQGGGARGGGTQGGGARGGGALEAESRSRRRRHEEGGGARGGGARGGGARGGGALRKCRKNTVVIVMLCVSRARTSHHIDLHFMRSRVIPESSSLVYTCIRRIPPPSSHTGSQSHRLAVRLRHSRSNTSTL